MSEELAIPGRLVHQVLQTLVAAHLVIEIAGAEPAFTPGRPVSSKNQRPSYFAGHARARTGIANARRTNSTGGLWRIRAHRAGRKAAPQRSQCLRLVNRADARLIFVPPSEPMKEIQISPALVPTHAETTVKRPVVESPPEIGKPEVKPEEINQKPPQQHEPEVSPVVTTFQQVKLILPIPTPKPPVAEPIPDDEREFPL